MGRFPAASLADARNSLIEMLLVHNMTGTGFLVRTRLRIDSSSKVRDRFKVGTKLAQYEATTTASRISMFT